MPKYRYVAMDPKGREVEGVVEAENESRAIAMIKEKGVFPTSVSDTGARHPAKSSKPGPVAKVQGKGKGLSMEIKLPGFIGKIFEPRVKLRNLMVFTRQLATLVDAGLPLLRGLHILQRQERHPALRAALGGMAEAVESGSTFAEALAQHPRIFSTFFINMVKAGEASGALQTVLNRLAEFMEKAQRIRNKVKGAMVYPVVVMVIAVAIVTVLMVMVIPKFRSIFDDLLRGEPLPVLTQVVISISNTVAHRGGYVIAGIIVLVIVLRIVSRTDVGRTVMDAAKLRAPVFGPLARKTAIANFTRTLGTLLTGGVPILQALNIVREITGNAVISRAVTQVHDSVKEGETMVAPLEASGVFPGMVMSMIQVGEETGALPEMLMKIAETYDEEVDTAVEALTSVIEPIMIIMLAVIVGTIVIAMFLPLVTIITKISG
jgi:type IV pilus assembly protein PilC